MRYREEHSWPEGRWASEAVERMGISGHDAAQPQGKRSRAQVSREAGRAGPAGGQAAPFSLPAGYQQSRSTRHNMQRRTQNDCGCGSAACAYPGGTACASRSAGSLPPCQRSSPVSTCPSRKQWTPSLQTYTAGGKIKSLINDGTIHFLFWLLAMKI